MPRIEPIKGSRAFNRINANVVDYRLEGEIDGQLRTAPLGNYDNERFQDSKQSRKPRFNSRIGQFDIRKEGGKLWTQADAEECLKMHPLQYEVGHKNYGDPITKCNIRDVDDLYFNHSAFIFTLNEGSLDLSDSELDKVKLQMARGLDDVKDDDGSPYREGGVRYRIKNPEMEKVREDKKLDDKLDALDLFRAVEDDTVVMIEILQMLGENPPLDLSRKALRSMLFPYVDDSVTTVLQGKTRQGLFREYAQLPPDERKVKATIKLALTKGHIQEKAGIYEFLGTGLGSTYGAVVDFFMDIKNSDRFDRLKMLIKDE